MIVYNEKDSSYTLRSTYFSCGDSFCNSNAKTIQIRTNGFTRHGTFEFFMKVFSIVEKAFGAKYVLEPPKTEKSEFGHHIIKFPNNFTMKYGFKLMRYVRDDGVKLIVDTLYELFVNQNMDFHNSIILAHLSHDNRDKYYPSNDLLSILPYLFHRPRCYVQKGYDKKGNVTHYDPTGDLSVYVQAPGFNIYAHASGNIDKEVYQKKFINGRFGQADGISKYFATSINKYFIQRKAYIDIVKLLKEGKYKEAEELGIKVTKESKVSYQATF